MFTHELLSQEPPSDETYEERAARFEVEARAAWNSFYVAVAVIVILCAVFAAHSVLDSAPPPSGAGAEETAAKAHSHREPAQAADELVGCIHGELGLA